MTRKVTSTGWFKTVVIALGPLLAPGYIASAAVGNITDVQQNGDTLTITAGSDILIFEVCRTNILRVDYRPGGTHAAPTQIIGTTNWPSVAATFDTSGDPIIIQTDSMRAEISRNPCRISLYNADRSTLLVKEHTNEGVFFDGVRFMPGRNSDFYGISSYYVWDNTSARMLRNSGGTVEAGYQGDSGAPIAYTRDGYGLLVDSDGGQFNINSTNLTFQFCSQPNILYYLVVGDPMDVMQGYMEISGKPPMLPKWAMGFANTEWGIDQNELTNIVATYRQKNIPIDQYVLDFDWKAWSENNYGEWRWNTTKFPDGPTGKLKQDMDAAGIKLGGIMKPRIHVNTVQGSYATTNNFWWPGQATYNDYFSGQPVKDVNYAIDACRQWYFDHITNAFDTGIIGWWNDEADQAGGGGAFFGNWQFLDMQRGLYDGQRAVSSQRVWSINRNFYLGSQRYAYAMWSGDIDGGFNAMANERIRMLSSINVGAVKWGMDIGGFNSGNLTTAECYARWMQFGALVPVYRVHGQQFNQRQPWVYGATAEAAAKAAIHLRYRLIPYIYSYERTSLETGVGIVRPFFYHWPEDAATANHVDGWMFGDWLLAAPVLTQGSTSKNIYLPKGTWFDYFKGTQYDGGQTITYALNNSTWTDIPLFIRKGAIIPTMPVMNYVNEAPVTNVTITVFPDWTPSSFTYYDDDGETYDYENGEWFKQHMTAWMDEGFSVIEIEAPEGGFIPDLETYTCRIYGPSGTAVMVNGVELTRYANSNELAVGDGEGWYTGEDQFGPVVNVAVFAGEAKSIVVSNNLVAAPVIDPDGGLFQTPVSVTVSSRTDGASIHYTLDGSEPNELSTMYTDPFTIWISSTLKAKAFMSGREPSETSSAQFTIDNNMLRNSGFEQVGLTSTNRARYWYPNDPDAHGDMWGTARRVNWRSHEGTWQGTVRGLWANAGSEGGFWQEASAAPGQTYRFSAWFWADSNWNAARQGIKLEYLSGQPAGTNYLSATTNLLTGIGTTWVKATIESTAPAGAEWVRVVIFAEGVSANGALQFDDLYLEPLGGLSLHVQSPHGSATPPQGTHFYSVGQKLTNSIDAAVIEGKTQYVCVGWSMAGHDPSFGTSNTMSMSLTNNAVLTWLWNTNVLETAILEFSSPAYTVAESSGTISIEVIRTGGTVGAVEVQYSTEDSGSAMSNLDYEATSGILYFADGQTSAAFTVNIIDDQSFEGDEEFRVFLFSPNALGSLGEQSSAFITITNDDPDLGSNTLSVVSTYGQTVPPEGMHYYPYGTIISSHVTNAVSLVSTQYVVAGWTGSGSVPSIGFTSGTPDFAITNDSEIIWNWATNVWFAINANGIGSISGPNTGWYPLGTNLILHAVAATNFTFAGWSGDIDDAMTNDNPLSIDLDYSRSLTALFTPNPHANLLHNPSWEIAGSSAGQAAYWYANVPDIHGEMWGTALRVNWQPSDGAWHGSIRGLWAGAGNQGGVWQEVPAVPDTLYRFTAWFWADSGNPYGPWYAAHQAMKLEFFHDDVLLLAVTNPLSGITQTWQPRTMEAVAPAEATWVRVVIMADGVGSDGSLQFDDLKLEILSILPSPIAFSASETNYTSFTANWSEVPEATGYSLHVATNADFLEPGWAADLFISEYAEGSSDNKAVELYNGTGRNVDLSNYRIWGINNGGSWAESELMLSNILAHGETHVIRNVNATNTHMIAVANQIVPSAAPMTFNGDDALGLAKNIGGAFVLIDAVGTSGPDPGSGWGVSGVADATRDHTLIRKANIREGNVDWASCSNEWVVLPIDVFTNLGIHAVDSITMGHYVDGYHGRDAVGTSLTVTGLLPGLVYYYRIYATNETGQSGYSDIISVTTYSEVIITAVAGPGGNIHPTGPISIMAGSSTNFLITAEDFYHIAAIRTNGSVAAITDSGSMLIEWTNIWAAGMITADFAENLVFNQTPEWWLHLHYGVTNYDEVAMDDSDGDGMPAWQEYWADTAPTNAASSLLLKLTPGESGQEIRFPSSTSRTYRLEYLPEATETVWLAVDGQTNIPGEPGITVLSDTNNHPQGWYRVGVSMPPSP